MRDYLEINKNFRIYKDAVASFSIFQSKEDNLHFLEIVLIGSPFVAFLQFEHLESIEEFTTVFIEFLDGPNTGIITIDDIYIDYMPAGLSNA